MWKHLVTLVALAVLGMTASHTAVADDKETKEKGKSVHLTTKIEESEAQSKLDQPNVGYVGELGSFVLAKEHSGGLIVVHAHPDTHKHALAHTKLTFDAARRLGNVDGWVYRTSFDGKKNPSKIFFSATKVYFGGGKNGYIAADYREDTGWAWKMLPLRRMQVATMNMSKDGKEEK